MNNWGEKNNWALGSSAANHGADQQVCGQTYIDLYNLDEIKNEIKIKAIKESIDDLIKNPTEAKDDWFWVDALYMAFHMCNRFHAEYHVFDIITDLLSNGRSSRFIQTLVQEKNSLPPSTPIFREASTRVCCILQENQLRASPWSRQKRLYGRSSTN